MAFSVADNTDFLTKCIFSHLHFKNIFIMLIYSDSIFLLDHQPKKVLQTDNRYYPNSWYEVVKSQRRDFLLVQSSNNFS